MGDRARRRWPTRCRCIRWSRVDEGDISIGEVLRDVGQTLIEKCVVTQVRVRVIRNDREVDDNRELQLVADGHRYVDGRVIQTALGALHPVDDALAAFKRGAVTADGDAGTSSEKPEELGKSACGGGMKSLAHHGSRNYGRPEPTRGPRRG